MDSFTMQKENQYKTMFFSLKILALFFCATPIFQFFFKDTKVQTFYNINVSAILIAMGTLIVIMFFWILMDYNRKNLKFLLFIEIILFFSVCSASILISGSYQSHYKFLYIFMIVSYTIEFGAKTGIPIVGASSLTLLGMDLFLYENQGVNSYFQSDLALSAIFVVVAWILGFYVKTESMHIEQLKHYANVDGLTEVYNHRYFHELFKHQCEKSIQEKQSLSLVMLDIDYFKNYNDMYGHQAGDQVLKEMAQLIKTNIRENDVVCRYGGEEFCIIMPNTDQETAISLADELRKKIYDYKFEGQEHLPNGSLSVSIGISELKDENDTYSNIISRSDAALYRAKYFRKNRVEVFSSLFDQFSHIDKAEKVIDNNMNSIKALITVINSRDRYTYNHIERVVYFCDIFANYLKLSNEDKKKLIYGAYLHDLGKINIAKEVLISEKKLTNEEWEELKKHPVYSAEIIRSIDGMDDVADIAIQHHEKYDGTGYPCGLAGKDINYLARILTLVDSFDAMTNYRPYQVKRTYDDAFDEIRRCSGTHFDPDLTEKFIDAVNRI